MDWPAAVTAGAASVAALGGVAATAITWAGNRKAARIEAAVNGASHAAAAELARVHGQLERLREELAAVQQERVDEAQAAG